MELVNCIKEMNDLSIVVRDFPIVDPLYNLNELLYKKEVSETIQKFQLYARGFMYDLYNEIAELETENCENITRKLMELHSYGTCGLENEYYDYVGAKRFECISDGQAREVVVKFLNDRIDEFVSRLKETREQEIERLEKEREKAKEKVEKSKEFKRKEAEKHLKKMTDAEKTIEALNYKISAIEGYMGV